MCAKQIFCAVFCLGFCLQNIAQDRRGGFLFKTRNTQGNQYAKSDSQKGDKKVEFTMEGLKDIKFPYPNWGEMIVVGVDYKGEENHYKYSIVEADSLVKCESPDKAEAFQIESDGNYAVGRGVYSPLNESMFYFSVCVWDKGATTCHIFRSIFKKGKWNEPEKVLKASRGSQYITPHIGIDEQGREVIYYAQKKKGKDFFQLMKAKLSEEGKILPTSKEKALSSENIEKGDFIAPFHDSNRKKLYFSYKKEGGDYDVYAFNEENGKQFPVKDVNEKGADEVFFAFIKGTNGGIFFSDRSSSTIMKQSGMGKVYYFTR